MAVPSGSIDTGRFAGLQFLFWASIVCFEAFMVPFLTDRGYSPSQAGFVMSAIFGFAIVGQPLLGSLSDRQSSPRWIVAGAMLLAGTGALLLPAAAHRYAAIVGIALLYSLTANSIPAVLDAWIMARRRKDPGVSYGVARGFGSLGFAVGAVAVGALAERFGTQAVFRAYAGIAVGTVILAVVAPGDRLPKQAPWRSPAGEATPAGVESKPKGQEGIRDGIRAALHNRAYLGLLAATLLAFIGFRAGMTFLPLALTGVGGSLAHVGIAHSLAAVSEVPVLFFSGRFIRRFGGEKLIVAVLSLMAVRLFGYSVAPTPVAILALQLTHGLTFGLFLAAVVHYIDEIAPAHHRGLFQAIAPSVFFGLGSVAGSWSGGVIVETLSSAWLYRLAAVATLAGAVLLPILAGRRGRTS